MRFVNIFILIVCTPFSHALILDIKENSDVVGKTTWAYTSKGESLSKLGRFFDVGTYDMIEANPNVNPWYPKENTKVLIPTEFILPEGKREGIVINLAEMRLYFFLENKRQVATFPVGIGRKKWCTPLGETKIIGKKENPEWRPPESIRKAAARKGKILPRVVAAGPNNPLGKYALRLGMPSYLIHGTNRPGGIGVRSSSGCIRMWPEDIKTLFYMVKVGTKVRIIHQPVKIGKNGSKLYLEAHQPLSDDYYGNLNSQILVDETVTNLKHYDYFNVKAAHKIVKEFLGYPRFLV